MSKIVVACFNCQIILIKKKYMVLFAFLSLCRTFWNCCRSNTISTMGGWAAANFKPFKKNVVMIYIYYLQGSFKTSLLFAINYSALEQSIGKLACRRVCSSSNKVRNQVPPVLCVRRPTKSGINTTKNIWIFVWRHFSTYLE